MGGMVRPALPRPLSLALVATLATSALAVGCKSKDLPLTATAKIVQQGGKDVVLVDVESEPRIEVRVNDSSYAAVGRATTDAKGHATIEVALPEPVGPTPAPTTTSRYGSSGGGLYGSSSGGLYGSSSGGLYGSSSGYGGLYGSSSGGTTTTSSNALMGSEIKLSLTAEQYQPRTVGRARYRFGNAQVTVRREPSVRYNVTTRGVACVGKPCTGTVSVSSQIRADFTNVEPGTVVDLGGTKARTVSRTLSVSVDATPFLDKVPLADVFQEYPMSSVDVPLSIEPGGDPAITTKCNIPANQLRPALTAFFTNAAKSGARFPEEAATAGGAKAIYVSPRGQLLGEAKSARDVDLVAVRTERDRMGCADGATDAIVTVHERRTGKVTTQKTFSAGSCNQDYEERAIEDWLRSLLK